MDYAREIKNRFPDAITMGATTFAAFCKEGAFKDTLMVLGFEEGINFEVGILEEVDQYPLKYVDRVKKISNKFTKPDNTICLEFSSALISCEELVLSTLNSVLGKKKISVFGGSAGDRGKAEKSMISFNGVIYDNACVFAIIENLGGKIKLYRENIYKPTKHYFKSTKVDVRKRIVYEYDGKPAAKVIADALMVNCLARSIFFESDGYLNEFATTVGSSVGNYVGFAGYGEQLNEQHFNQTMVLAVFE
ncbi:MAG: FIST N-terminal domain-containing protein [Lachnotalea sp.]